LSFTEHNPEAPRQFQRFAEIHIDLARKNFKFELSYDVPSIKKLDEMVDGIGKPKHLDQMIMLFGSFLGEAFRQLHKGRWEWNDHFKTWGVTFLLPMGGEETAFVFAKVEKRFTNGMEDSLAFFAEVTDAKAKGRIP
jgi:hypothetical protein